MLLGAAMVMGCGGEAVVKPPSGDGGATSSGSAGETGSGQVEGVDCYRCERVFSDSTFSLLPLCDGAAKQAHNALQACACDGTCNDECAMGGPEFCKGDTVHGPCGNCLEAKCPAEKQQCRDN